MNPLDHQARTPGATGKGAPGRTISLMLLLFMLLIPPLVAAQSDNSADPGAGSGVEQADVVVDGRALFPLRGISSFPASQRAKRISQRIIDLAQDPAYQTGSLQLEHLDDRSHVLNGSVEVLTLLNEDAELQSLDRTLLAEVYRQRIDQAISSYREERSTRHLIRSLGFALLATLLTALAWWGIARGSARLEKLAQARIARNLSRLEEQAHSVIRASQVWALFSGMLRGLRLLLLLSLAYFYLNGVLGLFPWTRPVAAVLFALVIGPLESMLKGLVAEIPDLAFLVVLFFVSRFLLRIIRLYFIGLQSGRIVIRNFDPDWADSTYKILRAVVVAFALVVAYPYIPGSNSLAFKGVSVFMGVMLSIGASSFISSMIAGLIMTYRGAFKEGDRVRIGATEGVVHEVKMMTTRIRTFKNEMVIVPNSSILSSDVTNLSTLARKRSLILHTIVGIGYDTPWRQVEAMLLEAARRTQGALQDPPPFVLQKQLGDFAVNYELNVYTELEMQMGKTYSDLHAHIQDVFNEYGVQIMSPAYEADPAAPKLVPREQFYAAPARAPGSGS